MDYSSVPGEEHLQGSSPWGSASPRASRTTFHQAAPDSPESVATAPDSPSAVPRHASHRQNHEDNLRGSGPVGDPSLSDPTAGEQTQPGDGPEASTQNSERAQLGEPEQQPGLDSTQSSQIPPNQQPPRPGQTRNQNARQQRPVPQYKLQAKITALERSGRKDPVLRFDVYTNLPKFRTTQFRDVRRTHSEFQKLADHLISSNPEAMVPAIPPSLTSAGAGTDEDEARVKSSLQRWLNYVCSNEVLMRDEEMVFFVESDFGYSPVVRMKQPATGVRRKVLKQFAPPPDDTPELHDARPIVKLFYLGSLDAGQKMERVVKARRGLGLAESSLGEKIAQLNVQETHPGLAHAFRKLGRIIQTCGDYHAAQGTAEATTLGDPLTYHANDAFIVKETLTNRHILLRELLQAETSRRSKENSVQRLKSSSSVRRDKVDEAISSLEEAVSQENYLRGKCQRVTANLLLEKSNWFDRTEKDVIHSIREYVLRQIEVERRSLATLESVRPDVRAIDASGGLSRLGRENAPSGRKISMASSQGVKGDAWSGVARSRDALNRSISGGFGAANLPEAEGAANGDASIVGRPRSGTGTGSLKSVKEDENDDRVDARNAASRLAQSTF